MRTTFKDLQSVTEILRNLSGINYRAFGESGAYFVGVKHEDTSIGEIVVRGTLKECNIAVKAVLNAYHYQKRNSPAPNGPQFVIRVADGMVQNVVKIGAGEIKYIIVDEDEIECSARHERAIHFSSTNALIYDTLICNLSELVHTTLENCEDSTPAAIATALGYTSPDLSPAQ